MPEQNSQNAKAFDPASFSMPAQPSLTYSVVANATQPELSSYVQTVFHRTLGSITPGARLSDQASSDIRPAQVNTPAQQPPAPPVNNRVSKYQRTSVQFNLSDQGTESTESRSNQPNQQQSFAPPADHSNLPYIPRTDVSPARQADSSATVLDAARRKVQETENQNPVAKESQVAINKTKLVDLRQGSAQTETPQRDQNTIAKKPQEFLKREAFSNKFKVTPSGERELEKAETTGKIIYLKSVPPVEHTAKWKVPKLVQETAPEPVAEPAVPQPPKPQIIQWPIVDSAQEQVLFPAPFVTVSPSPKEVDFVSASPAIDAETTKIDFAEVNMKVSAEPANEQITEASTNPFETTEAPEALDQFSGFQSSQDQTSPIKSSPFESTPEATSPFQSSPKESSPFESTPEELSPVKSSPFESSPFESSPEESSPFESTPQESSPFESTPQESSPFESTPEESSPFESPPEESSPFRSTLFQSAPLSPFESENVVEHAEDFSVPAPPVTSVAFAGNNQDVVPDLDTAREKKETTSEAPAERSDFGSSDSQASLKPESSPFHVIGHRRPELTKDLAPTASKFENADSQAAKNQNARIILPEFKPSVSVENANQQFTATTLQSGHRAEARSDQQFETPWLSPWWMLIGLIPIALYMGTMKLFKDEDEYHSHKNELFGSHLEFGSDFGEMGRSKSDAVYGRQDEVPVAHGPSGEAVRLDVDPMQSPIAFAETLQFELPSSTEVADPSFEKEIRIDQSPNFSESRQQSSGPKKKRQRNARKKRSNR